ncbi:Uncharacterized protein conserved in bacteria [Phocoenobacter uteri]|uniref:Uncharacterized protein conserved in bacteria n=1 Tax=Phocoenobacter uteri TaxID=146806 RepID=A0A379C8T2_9PAST|nr:DUF3944 domain-containing protein [Phocoenobacter uteri]MDG6882556.1 hypothetical protein [Phocoenobacter uteri]SUB58720.1 Uncharacterized protein conserved in bacteria [Phocoenobacter uteri]
MAYRYDPDLDFLQHLESADLKELYDVLVYGKDGQSSETTNTLMGVIANPLVATVYNKVTSKRITETLSSSDERKKYGDSYSEYWQRIAEEFQKFGGSSLLNFTRNSGVPYREILFDVCDKLKVNYNKNASTVKIEQDLLMKILEKSLEDMSASEKEELARNIGIENTDHITPELLTAAFLKIFRMGGFKSYQLTVTIVNAILKVLIGRGLPLAGNVLLTKTMSILTGPIGWAITGLWTAVDIAGPAYRVTIPAVITVIGLRQKYINKDLLADLDIK